MDEMEKNSRKALRNAKIANILVNESYFFKHLLENGMDVKPSRVVRVDIDYDKIMTMSEYIEEHPEIGYNNQGSPIFDKIYNVPVKITYAGGATQTIDAIFDDYATNIGTIAHGPYGKGPDFSTFTISKRYQEQCTNLANMLIKKGYSKTTVQAIMKMAISKSYAEMLQTIGNQNRVIPLNEKAIDILAQKYEVLVKEGKTPEELNNYRLEELMVADETREKDEQKTKPTEESQDNGEEDKEKEDDKDIQSTQEPVEEDKEEDKEEEEEQLLANSVGVDKISNVLKAANVRASQVQDIIFVRHPRELNQYLPGEYKINNDQEVTLIKLRGGLREPSRFEILQGEGDNIQRIETHGLYNDTLNEIFPEKSTIGANAYDIKQKNKKEVKVDFSCDGKVQIINLSDVPISQRVNLDKQAMLAATIEEIQRRTEIEKEAAEKTVDPVEREKALARVHERANDDLTKAQVPGTGEDTIIDDNVKEIVEHLKAADEAEKIKAEEERKRKEEEEKEAAENEEPQDEVSIASKVMLVGGAAAVGLTALSDKDINNLLADVGEPPKTIASEHDDHSEGRGPRVPDNGHY